MKMKLTIALLACAATLSAQNVSVTRHTEVTPEGGAAYFPVLSPDGSKMAYTSSNYTGLKVLDFTTGESQVVSFSAGAGFDPVFSIDGSAIYYRQQSTVGGQKLRSLSEYNLDRKSERQLIAPTRDLKRPAAIAGGMAVFAGNKLFKSVGSRINSLYVYSVAQEGTIVVCDGKTSRVLRPYGNQVRSYLWTTLSPDGTKIATYAIGKGVVVLDLDGKVLAELGDFEAPAWYGNDFVAAARTTDDGHQYTASQIVLLDRHNRQVHNLTAPDEMGMNPSAAAGKIVYNTPEGKLFMLELNITK